MVVLVLVGMLTNADEHVFWSGAEIERMIDCWEQNAEAVNSSRNEKAMSDIAAYINTNKSAKQVRAKVRNSMISTCKVFPHH